MTPHPINSNLPAPDDITAQDGLRLSELIASKKVSCKEVMQAYITRIEQVNPKVNAIVALRDSDALLKEAEAADQDLAAGNYRGWMHGMPQAPKDLALTKALVTTYGSPIFKDFVPAEDNLTVERARNDGAIIIGKTNTPEFGLGSQTFNKVYGATRNALNPALCAGGSSGGAAVAIALHLLPVGDGSDMMGSLRNPAAFNGIYGFRPSAGRVPGVPGKDQYVSQLGTEGPMGRHPRECARLLATQAGYSIRAPLSLAGDGSEFIPVSQYQAGSSKPLAGKTIGWFADLEGYLPMQDGVLERCQVALKVLQDLGATIEPAKLDYPPETLWKTWLTLRQGLQGGFISGLCQDPALRAQLKPEAIWEAENALTATAADFFQASAERTRWYLKCVELTVRYNFLLLPTAQVFPFDVQTHWPKEIAGKKMDTYHRWMQVVLPATMAGLPAINLPVLPDQRDGHATTMAGVQLIGAPQADSAVLQAAIAYADAIVTQ